MAQHLSRVAVIPLSTHESTYTYLHFPLTVRRAEKIPDVVELIKGTATSATFHVDPLYSLVLARSVWTSLYMYGRHVWVRGGYHSSR
jgi:hypothetical protein